MPPDSDLNPLALRVANTYQHGMPICARPYQVMARTLGCQEHELLDCLRHMHETGILGRIGPVFEHRLAGASTLAALSVPAHRIDSVALHISQYPEVNHNYLRDHPYNLWFVLTAAHRSRIDDILAEIVAHTGLDPLDLPMVRGYRIDLGFPLEST
ncbi:Lrp/AsnC family transcriptional regulator [Bordetella petrii]|uniref:Lrp/AsnC family transcriptional regulator n=1 Tax=Bordetella petrii TaxID=94624 RepID=UPI001E3D31F8|nr:Lrp/AsnC family transcriptional regulator [Bordetella petrii]MCD0501396.1 Lrp/AsnC family transcriptional regulator [Bordetella petrii]